MLAAPSVRVPDDLIGIVPEVIYVDASHHYEDVLQDLSMCLARFPNARICGDDWDYPPVARAATDAAVPLVAAWR